MKSIFPEQGERLCEGTADTQKLGEELGAALDAGDLVVLDGPLGAGKTTFTQGIARGMGVKGRVTSPTFVIAREHSSIGNGPSLVHVDAYRLGDDPLGELDALDLDSALEEAVVVAEWGGGLVEQLALRYVHVTLDRRTHAETEARIISWRVEDGM
ncbi:tRNA threonylcarbamoyladenosine biosynthesis protein TsaE [Corynebacterium afermentans subsp. afermentans]|uniref:tRNA threonylcarbamoyladenosine biosynthesis protein TsaE n=1 Tax=Corynebacterium afermentans TaxID=38286 RepID=A0A9X8R7B7_9CORY|nr:tRNA (adenosine(37)-N6)-threonylcarbamoyltransferase complex ATPase subunit type 1 TsaE [Corynebacterium afermentans]OAA16709.1 tRNA threonylcarbamoyladenosine biosynthesis protein TsaE [Corynebacterium afermentans subsp. afermentans]WJY56025.1 tRNA threonylcarbamoyladenosine biosynthesis protein TsaE [Corynebacterium afermentans subsp. afermentans]SIQ80356.1 tRNA threonylcarbamoyladenosine biosynthesis protein TsaE [Corynebacterium afermentans]